MNNSGEISELSATLRANIQRALAPSRTMTDMMKAMQMPLYTSYIGTHFAGLGQMMSVMQQTAQMPYAISRPFQSIADSLYERTQAQLERIIAPYSSLQKMVQSQDAVFEKLSASITALCSSTFSMSQFEESALACNVASIGLLDRMGNLGLLAHSELLATRLLEPPRSYTAFLQHTVERLAAAPAPDIAVRLRGSVKLAEHQLIGIADAISRFMVIPDDQQVPDRMPNLRAPYEQQDELLSCDAFEDETDIDGMERISPAANKVERARRIQELVVLCNEAGKTSPCAIEIFKPTTRLMDVFNYFPWLTASDKSSFGNVLDCLYFILYEGAGKDKLRFLVKHGGPLSESDCDPIWCIKRLRNKWSRHDADHGEEKDIKKSWAELAGNFRWLGLAEHPTERQHFQQLHQQLLIAAEDFLKLILSKLKLKQ